MSWFDLIKVSNADVARHVLEGPSTNNPHENYDLCCEHAREAAEMIIRDWGTIGQYMIASAEWKNFNCDNMRKELEMLADMGYPGIQQVIDAWDKCAEMGGADDLV
jgi:hypothetical protein